MKRIIVILILCLSCCFPVAATIVFRQAVSGDAKQLIELFKNFTKDDKQKLLVFPERLQSDIIADAIIKGKLFVAYDDKDGKIVSFLKLYVITSHEINEILIEELNLGLQSPVVSNYCYHFPEAKEINFKQQIHSIALTQETKNTFLSSTEEAALRSGTNACLYLYYGSAYTLPSHRGGGLASRLLMYAFNAIKSVFKDKKYYALLYGQVNANVGNYAMVRVFADAMQHAYPRQAMHGVTLQHITCRAYKPDFNSNGELKVYKDKEHEGLGSMVVYTVNPVPRSSTEHKAAEMKISVTQTVRANSTHKGQREEKKESNEEKAKLLRAIKMIYGFGDVMNARSA